jgi:hypothetical protein
MKQLEPTSVDEYIEHTVGEVVSGRLIEVTGGRAAWNSERVAICRLKESAPESRESRGGESKADISAMTAMLSARRNGRGAAPEPRTGPPGQVRTFKISSIDAAHKKIEVGWPARQ